MLGGRGLLDTSTLDLQPRFASETTKRRDGTRSLAFVADLGGHNADRSWSTCNSTVSLSFQHTAILGHGLFFGCCHSYAFLSKTRAALHASLSAGIDYGPLRHPPLSWGFSPRHWTSPPLSLQQWQTSLHQPQKRNMPRPQHRSRRGRQQIILRRQVTTRCSQ